MDWSTVIPVAVAVLAVAVGWMQNKRTLEQSRTQNEKALAHSRTLHDLGAVRSLFDAAALKLHAISYPVSALGFAPHEIDSSFDEAIGELAKAGSELDDLLVRLWIRLGSEHEIAVAFHEAEDAAFDVLRSAERAVRKDRREQRSGPLDQEDILELKAACSRFENHRVTFLKAAQRWAGARLSPPGD